MIAEKIDFIVEDLIFNENGDKDLAVHAYLGFLEQSILAGNLFLCRYKARLGEFETKGYIEYDT